MTIVAILAVAVVVIAGCAVALSNNNGSSAEKITIGGSTTVAPIMLAIQEQYENELGLSLSITATGSGDGASGALNGTIDLGMMSREPKSSEAGLTTYVIALDGVVVAVDKDAGVSNLTLDQINKIYSGEYTNWDQVGGNNLIIKPMVREANSGTRSCFEEFVGLASVDMSKYATYGSNGEMVTAINNVSGAIGYIGLGYVSELTNGTTVSVNGIDATKETITDGTYPISRSLILVTKGAATGAVLKLIEFVQSAKGQKVVEECGYISI